jgi:hypothetical protein
VCSFIVTLAISCFLCGTSGEMARRAINAGGMTAVPIRSAKRGAQSKVTNLLTGRAGLPKAAAIVTDTNVNPLAVSTCSVWLEEAAFFGDFLCSRKESYPPAGEAVTE